MANSDASPNAQIAGHTIVGSHSIRALLVNESSDRPRHAEHWYGADDVAALSVPGSISSADSARFTAPMFPRWLRQTSRETSRHRQVHQSGHFLAQEKKN